MPHSLPTTILCPVDFSEVSAAALKTAQRFLSPGARLLALHVNRWEPPAYFTHAHVQELSEHFQAAASQAGATLDEFVRASLGGADSVDTQVVDGYPADAILAAATAHQGSWIVIGTHGRSGWNRWTLGSVAERVLHQSTTPVITVRSLNDAPVTRILCPVNNTLSSREALRHATDLAAHLDANVTVLHVVESDATAAIANVCDWIDPELRKRCLITEQLRHGNAAQEIVSLARERPFDLIVMGAPRRQFFDGMVLSSTALRVVRHASCPVLTIPSDV